MSSTGRFDYFLWRTTLSWKDAVAAATAIIEQWQPLTPFVQFLDKRDCMWTVRHESTPVPFFVLTEDKLRGSVPRVGDPMAALLLLCLVRAHPEAFQIAFTDGVPLDVKRLEASDLVDLLPHAKHPVFARLYNAIAPATPKTDTPPGPAAGSPQ